MRHGAGVTETSTGTLPAPRTGEHVVVLDEPGLASGRLRARLGEALADRPERLVVDLSACAVVGASALTVLLEVHRAARRQGGALVLRGAGPGVERLLALTGVTGVFALEPAV